VSSARHKQVVQHAFRRRLVRLAAPATAALAVTGSVVGVAVTHGGPDAAQLAAAAGQAARQKPMRAEATTAPADSPYLAARSGSFSRSAKRVTLQVKPDVEARQYMTSALNLWPEPRESGEPLDVLEAGGKVGLTGVERNGFAQILYDDQLRWVNADYLSAKKPQEEPPEGPGGSAGVSFAPCPDGSGTESGLTPSAVRMFRAVCNAFPELSTYGGYDAHGEHSSGRAVDFMVTDPALGQAVADWARAHASELDLFDVLWSQQIWTPVRSSEGWRSMPDRGSATANHFDHVHISVN
jgi:hypothetical protein